MTTATDKAADEWFTPGRFALILLVLLGAAYPDVLRGRDTFFFRDFGFFGYPLAHYFRESFWRGEIPLWNPLNNCGLPFLAQWNTLVLYPGSLFYLLLPLSWALGFFCLGHLYLAGMGMYWLAHRWVGNRLAASVAGLAFALNGLAINCLMWPNNVAALAWMPFVVLFVERAWRDGGRHLVWAAVVGALQMLTGAPEIILFTWVFVGMMAFGQFVTNAATRRQMTWRLGIVVLLVSGLAAVQLLPFLDLLRHSQRTVNFATSDWAMPINGWANFLVPMFHCFQNRQGVYFQAGQYWTSSYYLGIGVFALILFAVGRVRERRVWLLAGAMALSLVLALGEQGFLYDWLRTAVPQFGFMRFPIKFVTLAVFCAPLLAAYGIRHYQDVSERELARAWRWNMILCGGLLLMIADVLWFDFYHPLNIESWADTWHSGLSRGGFLILIFGALYALRQAERRKLKLLLRLGLFLLLGLDVLTNAPRQNPTLPRSIFQPNLATVYPDLWPKPVPALGESRAMLSKEADTLLRYQTTEKPERDYFYGRLGLFSNCNLLDGVPKVNGFFSLYLRETDNVISLAYDSTNALPALYDFLAVSQITAPGKFADWEFRRTALPLVSGGQKPVFADEPATLAALAATHFNPRAEVFLPREAQANLLVTNASTVKVLARTFSAQHAELQVEATQPALVVVSQAYYHPWHAYVDGRREPIWRANLGFQALQVPAGRHTVRLAYEDRALQLGAVLSALSVLVCLGICLRPRAPTVASNALANPAGNPAAIG